MCLSLSLSPPYSVLILLQTSVSADHCIEWKWVEALNNRKENKIKNKVRR
uniref:Uncharacterized protein n=1 Tax=Octopus bimaculoides TaxID=37653 RepID=A0A0L8IH29_OCTBM